MGIVETIFVKPTEQQRALQALPPWAQEQRERDAIKNDPRLQEKIGNSIYEILKTESGKYKVVTDWCEMEVDVRYLPRVDDMCGPARFELVFHDPVQK